MGQTSRISKNNTAVLREDGNIKVVLHNTCVVHADYKAKTVTYNTGGWLTVTTIARMNQAGNELNLPYRVSRAGGVFSWRNIQTGVEGRTDKSSITLPL